MQDIYYEFSTNDVDIFRIISPEVFYEMDILKDILKFKSLFNKIAGLSFNCITKKTPKQIQKF